ncbi:MAG TPA: phosphate ABC transporter substrate-binding protein PstS [Caulobacteraceae bacterium]|jgi:phosphate transport system substrate-binding protein|nr:phosphate ABC transporter substrate-binding protein PstS [Caulobacteraceae bacterium]
MTTKRVFVTVLACAVGALALAACQPKGGATNNAAGGEAAGPSGNDVTGAGATFPAPVYTKWAEDYKAKTNIGLNYQAIGSGGGIKQIEAGTVDFGASDKPLKPEDLEKNGLYQFPTVIGGIVPAINLPGVQTGQLKLTGQVLADIYLGNIKTWNDPKITALNPGVKLPATPITTVHRSDGSGTNFLFTTYLSSLSPAFQTKVGASDSVQWPGGLGGKGNPGVAAFVKQTVGSIGYVEYIYAQQNHIPYALVQNKDGQYPQPVAANFAAAAAGADWTHALGNYLILLNQPGANSWPITGATFILLHKSSKDGARTAGALKFFDWAYTNGDATASTLAYVPLPQAVKDMVRKQWADQLKDDSGKPVWPAQ